MIITVCYTVPENSHQEDVLFTKLTKLLLKDVEGVGFYFHKRLRICKMHKNFINLVNNRAGTGTVKMGRYLHTPILAHTITPVFELLIYEKVYYSCSENLEAYGI